MKPPSLENRGLSSIIPTLSWIRPIYAEISHSLDWYLSELVFSKRPKFFMLHYNIPQYQPKEFGRRLFVILARLLVNWLEHSSSPVATRNPARSLDLGFGYSRIQFVVDRLIFGVGQPAPPTIVVRSMRDFLYVTLGIN